MQTIRAAVNSRVSAKEPAQQRIFRREGDAFCDEWTTHEGQRVTIKLPRGALIRPGERSPVLVWAPDHEPRSAEQTSPADPSEREHLAQRLRIASASDLTAADAHRAWRLGDPRVSTDLSRLFSELVRQDPESSDQLSVLAAVAEAILLFDPSHVAAAKALERAICSTTLSTFHRSSVSASLARAYRSEFLTEAMASLRDTILRLLELPVPRGWSPATYPCLGHLARLARKATLRRCTADLLSTDEATRESLLNRLSQIAGADVLLMLRGHLGREASPRLRFRLLTYLDELVPVRTRGAVLADALVLESPWWRWQAIQELWRLRSSEAASLAATQLQREPDELLRDLLEQAVKAAPALRRQRKRS